MNKTEQAVLSILSEIMNDQPRPMAEDLNWEEVYTELKSQALVPLTYVWVKKHGIPDAKVSERWRVSQLQQFCRWYSMMKAQQEMTKLLMDSHHAVAILKGTANGVNYPQPQYRISTDIDFLVRMSEFEDLYSFMISNGYTLQDEKDKVKHHIAFRKNGFTFEMHKCPGGCRLNENKTDKEIVQFFQNGLNKIEIEHCVNYDIPVLSKLHTAMVLLLHTSQHMKGGLGLRHILDWMMFAKANVDDNFWNTELKPMAEKAHLVSLAKVMTKMCQTYLGLTTENMTWCKDADDYLCDQLIEYVFQQGDFGIKVKGKDKEVRVLTDFDNEGGFWRKVIESSYYSMPPAKKIIILRPIAIIYQLIRYAVQWIHRDHPLRTYLDARKKARKRSAFFNELGVKRY